MNSYLWTQYFNNFIKKFLLSKKDMESVSTIFNTSLQHLQKITKYMLSFFHFKKLYIIYDTNKGYSGRYRPSRNVYIQKYIQRTLSRTLF